MVTLREKYVSILLTAVVLFLISSVSVFASTIVDETLPDDDDDVEQSCMRDAVSDRDVRMITAWEEYSMVIMSALEMRRSDVMESWSIEDNQERRRMLRAAWDEYTDARKDSRKSFMSEKRKAWNEYRRERTICHGRAEDLAQVSDQAL